MHKQECLKHDIHRLSQSVRVLRHRDGAIILNPQDMIPSDFTTSTDQYFGCNDDCMNKSKKQKSKHHDKVSSCPCYTKYSRPCVNCSETCTHNNPLNYLNNQRITSTCALMHLSVIKGLSKEQLASRYKLACAERWGGKDHQGDEETDQCIALGEDCMLSTSAPCGGCGNDGEQWFSFCLNRFVNADRVSHCTHCGKCFYFRPGFLGCCQHCGFQENGSFLFDGPETEIIDQYSGIRENLDPMELGMAAEGYWGY